MAEERLEEIRKARLAKREKLINEGMVPYPPEARRTHVTAQVLDQFEALQSDSVPIILAGRILSIRKHGGVVFIDLDDVSGTMQLQITKEEVAEDVFNRLDALDVGDFIQAAGLVTTTSRGEKSLLVNEFHLLSKSIRPLPDSHYGLKDDEKRFRQREVDFLLNQEARDVMYVRGQITKWLRTKLQSEGFEEVETPILQSIAGGAQAEPFVTRHKALNIPLYLRIAPELYLKRLIVGGLEKVFEIGRCFRNEGIDREHNPEFTMCEGYWAYADYEDLMNFFEKIISDLTREVLGKEEIKNKTKTITITMPWKRLRYVEVMSEKIGIDILEEKDPTVYEKILQDKGLDIPKVRTYSKLVDELYKEIVRPTLVQPTLLYDYPVEMVPFGKQSVSDSRIVEKFQVLIAGVELVNAYTELNDPVEQRRRLEEQQKDKAKGDKEVAAIDEDYLRAMEYGMPPMAGWGMGIDRLAALLSGAHSVRDTIAFPLLRPEK